MKATEAKLLDFLRIPLIPVTYIKVVAVQLLERLKAEKLQVDHWRDKEATRPAIRYPLGCLGIKRVDPL